MGLRNRIIDLVVGIAVAAALMGCSHMTQTTSGRDYLRVYVQEAGPRAPKLDKDIVAAASVEPLLRFPGRIGLARLDRCGLAGIPSEEAVAWQRIAVSLGPKFGEFVPVSPMIAQLVASEPRAYASSYETVHRIQLAAARQHLDAVIIYESEGTADSRGNPLSIGEWTLIDAFILPSQDVDARGFAQAMMIDVRNGYPYGTAQAEATESSVTVRVATDDTEKGLAESVRLAAVENLAPEVEKMIRELRTELAEKREARRGR